MFTLMFEVFILVLVVVGGFFLLNSTAVKRLFGAGKAQLGRVGRAAWNADPIAILEQKRDEQMNAYQTALKTQTEARGGLESLKAQVIRSEQEVNRLDAKVKNALSSGDETRAKQYVMALQKEKDNLETNRKQLEAVQKAYDNNTRQIKLCQNGMEVLRSDIMQLRAQSRSAAMERKLGEMLTGMQVNIDVDGIAEAKQQAEYQINRDRGAALVQAELGNPGFSQLEEQEREREDNANSLLEQYKKNMGK